MNLEKHYQLIATIRPNLESNEKHIALNLEQHTKASGEEVSEMASVPKYGLMELNMRGNGNTIELMVLESLFMLIKMNMKGNGRTIRPTEEEFTDIKMEPRMTGIGKMICKMERVSNNGLTKVFIKEITQKERSMVMACTNGQINPCMRENGKKTR